MHAELQRHVRGSEDRVTDARLLADVDEMIGTLEVLDENEVAVRTERGVGEDRRGQRER